MQREFSKELGEDREFEWGGETFRFRLFHYTETIAMLDTKLSADLVVNDDGSFSWKANTEFCIKEIQRFLDGPDEVKKFKAVLARKTNPVPRFQIDELYLWLREKVQGLPTNPPSSGLSGDGGGSNGAESSAVSSSTGATSSA